MASKLIIDRTTTDGADHLKDCQVGESKTLEVVVTPTSVNDGEIVADIDEIRYSDSADPAEGEGEYEEQAPKEMPSPMKAVGAKMGMKGNGKV